MTQQEFQMRSDRIIAPLINAYRCRCLRTAKARLRDLARLYREAYGYTEEQSLATAKANIYERFNIEL